MQALRLLLLLQCYWINYYYMYNSIFHISILSTDLILIAEWQLLRDYKLKGTGGGWGGGVQNICVMAFFFALYFFFLDCFVFLEHKEAFGRRGDKWRPRQKISEDGEPRRNTLASNCVLSDRAIHLSKDFFIYFLNQIYWWPTRPLLPTAVDDMIFNLAQRPLLSHCALPHHSARAGGATNECSPGFNHAEADGGDKIFWFWHFLKKEKKEGNLCFMVYIVTLLLEFVSFCPMYLFHHVQCIGDLYLQALCCWILPRKKCMTSWREESLLVCLRSSLSAYPLILLFVSILSPMSSIISVWSYPLIVPFLLILRWSVDWSSETEQEIWTCLFCVVMVLVMQFYYCCF